jgi:hypothetical protein
MAEYFIDIAFNVITVLNKQRSEHTIVRHYCSYYFILNVSVGQKTNNHNKVKIGIAQKFWYIVFNKNQAIK